MPSEPAWSRTRSIRLGDLDSAVQRAADAAGQGASEWIRAAIIRALDGNAAVADSPMADRDLARARVTIRTSAQSLERWQREAAEEGVSLNRYVELQLSLTADSRHRVSQAISELRADTVAMAAVARDLNQLVRRLGRLEARLTESDLREIGWVCASVDAHKAASSALVRAMMDGADGKGRGRA